MFAVSLAGAQALAPTLGPTDRTRSAARATATTACSSRVATLDEHERIAVLCVDSLDLSAIHDLTDLLSSRIPGVLVQQTSGTPGTAARIRVRGPGSILLDEGPIVIIDGVRSLARPIDTPVMLTQAPSRLDDIDIHDIAFVEVLRGPATSAIYGVGAAHGVIRITTRRGLRGRPRWKTFAQAGSVIEPTRYPANYTQRGISTSSGATVESCTLDDRGQGLCTPGPFPLASFNPLEQVSQFRQGFRQDLGTHLSGGNRLLGFHAGVARSHDEGVVGGSDVGRTHLRANVDVRPLSRLAVGFTSSYLSGDAHFPQSGTAVSLLYSGMLGYAFDDPAYRGYLDPPDSLGLGEVRQQTDRLGAGVSASWSPLSWLSAEGGVGVDRTDTDDLLRLPNDFSQTTSALTTATLEVRNQTAGASATAEYPLATEIRGRSRVGWHQDQSDVEQRSQREDGGEIVARSWTTSERRVAGLYLQQHVSWRDRLAIDASLRRDELRHGSGKRPKPMSGSLGVSWMARRAATGRGGAFDGPLRVHAVYGRVGSLPAAVALPSTSYRGGWEGAEWQVERTEEYELGLNSSLLRNRLRVSLAWYHQTTTNAFLLIYSPSEGFQRLVSGAEIENTGIEATIGATVQATRALNVAVDLGLWNNSNELASSPFSPLSVDNGFVQVHAEGYPLGAFWAGTILSYQDLNGDGIISRKDCPGRDCEITTGPFQYRGSALPRLEIFLSPKVTVAERVIITALIDYRGGFKQLNRTEDVRCAYQRCRGISDASASLEDQARALSVTMSQSGFGRGGGFIEDGSFLKLRELSVSTRIPESWTRAIGTRSAHFAVAGRNLGTLTPYSGLDPEITSSGPFGFAQGEYFTQPPLRYFSARLSFGW